MKVIDRKCPHCGGDITYKEGTKSIKCEYCGSILYIENENSDNKVYESSEEAGYNFEKGRQRAKSENIPINNYNNYSYGETTTNVFDNNYDKNEKKTKKKFSNKLLWILGWLLIFPIPITILISRSEKISKGWKVFFIVLVWMVYLSLGNYSES